MSEQKIFLEARSLLGHSLRKLRYLLKIVDAVCLLLLLVLYMHSKTFCIEKIFDIIEKSMIKKK